MSEDQVDAEQMTPKQRRKAAAKEYENRRPEWQKWVNSFCENWIFAFIIAMGIRHFVIEAYRIPTASMEPVLYGDPHILKGDTVVVDKFLFRFTGPKRFGVTVFQYPIPEVSHPQAGARIAVSENGDRADNLITNPQMQRNFVKRCLVVPGDVFYIANGDLFLQGEDGSFAPPTKPEAIQEALWLPIYAWGEDPRYLPWKGLGGAAVKGHKEGPLEFTFGPGAESQVGFTQPFTNIYLKPGLVDVVSFAALRRQGGGRQGAWTGQRVDVSMLRPTFEYPQTDGTVERGNIYDYQTKWAIRRLTSADIDNPAGGTLINDRMTEFVGDIRCRFRISQRSGDLTLRLSEGSQQVIDLVIADQGWKVLINGTEKAAGTQNLNGQDVALANVDDVVSLMVGGQNLASVDVAAVDPQEHPSALFWRGNGSAALAMLEMDRDVHYCKRGLLASQTDNYRQWRGENGVSAMWNNWGFENTRQHFIEAMVDPNEVQRRMASFESRRNLDWLEPLGYSPETALKAPENAYLLLGDNSPFSFDGREWGWVPGENLRGTVLAALMPRMKVVR